jgi:hypothetical protein
MDASIDCTPTHRQLWALLAVAGGWLQPTTQATSDDTSKASMMMIDGAVLIMHAF